VTASVVWYVPTALVMIINAIALVGAANHGDAVMTLFGAAAIMFFAARLLLYELKRRDADERLRQLKRYVFQRDYAAIRHHAGLFLGIDFD